MGINNLYIRRPNGETITAQSDFNPDTSTELAKDPKPIVLKNPVVQKALEGKEATINTLDGTAENLPETKINTNGFTTDKNTAVQEYGGISSQLGNNRNLNTKLNDFYNRRDEMSNQSQTETQNLAPVNKKAIDTSNIEDPTLKNTLLSYNASNLSTNVTGEKLLQRQALYDANKAKEEENNGGFLKKLLWGSAENDYAKAAQGGLQQYIGSVGNAIADIIQPSEGYEAALQRDAQKNPDGVSAAILQRRQENGIIDRNDNTVLKEAQTRATADALSALGSKNIASAQEGASVAKKLLLDVEVGAEQMAMDIALGYVSGLGMMAPMMVRSYGGGEQTARTEYGADKLHSVAYGATSAGVEALTEAMWNTGKLMKSVMPESWVGKVFKNAGEDAMEAAWANGVSKLTKNMTSAAAKNLTYALGSLGLNFTTEAVEEATSALVEPIMNNVLLGTDEQWGSKEHIKDVLWEGLVGGVIGILGEGVATPSKAKAGKIYTNTNTVNALTEIAMNGFDKSSNTYKLGSQIKATQDGGGKVVGQQMYDLMNSISPEETKIAKLTDLDIVKKNLTGDTATDKKVVNGIAYLTFDSANKAFETVANTNGKVADASTKKALMQAKEILTSSIVSNDISDKLKPYYVATLGNINSVLESKVNPVTGYASKPGVQLSDSFSTHSSNYKEGSAEYTAISEIAKANNIPFNENTIVTENPTGKTYTFTQVDDFNGNNEPVITSVKTVGTRAIGGKYVVKDNTPKTTTSITNKAAYVADNYSGFNVASQKSRESSWKADAKRYGISYNATKLNDTEYFNNLMKKIEGARKMSGLTKSDMDNIGLQAMSNIGATNAAESITKQTVNKKVAEKLVKESNENVRAEETADTGESGGKSKWYTRLDDSRRTEKLAKFLDEYQRRGNQAETVKSEVNSRGLAQTSAEQQGIKDGSAENTMTILPDDMVENLLKKENITMDDLKRFGVNKVILFSGKIGLNLKDANGNALTANGYTNSNGTVWACADDANFTLGSIIKHESMHNWLNAVKGRQEQVWRKVVDALGADTAYGLLDDYIASYATVCPNMSEEDVLQELLCDAMGELNRLGFEDVLNPGATIAESATAKAFEETNTVVGEDSEIDLEDPRNSLEPPYTTGTNKFKEWAAAQNEETKKVLNLFTELHDIGRKNNVAYAVDGSKGKVERKPGDITTKFMLASDWNYNCENSEEFSRVAKELAAKLPKGATARGGFNQDGTIKPTELEDELKVKKSYIQRVIDTLPDEVIKGTKDGTFYDLKDGDKTVRIKLSDKSQILGIGGEAYRQALLNERRKLYAENPELIQKEIGGLSKDNWGAMGFIASSGKTQATGDFSTVCPNLYFNKGCLYCYRTEQLRSGMNNKLAGERIWYTGEILRLKPKDIERLNNAGGLRIQSFGDWQPQFTAELADVLYDAEKVGLQVKIITKFPSLVDVVAEMRKQGLGKNIYFNISCDHVWEKAGADNGVLKGYNLERPTKEYNGELYWKRALSIEEAKKYRDKYDWVNIRTVALNVDDFISDLMNPNVDVVTGYHGPLSVLPGTTDFEKVTDENGELTDLIVEKLGNHGMPQFKFDNGIWKTVNGGKNEEQQALCKRIEDLGLQLEYYAKVCCVAGKCAECTGLCGLVSKNFYVKNMFNRDTESFKYWENEAKKTPLQKNILKQMKEQYQQMLAVSPYHAAETEMNQLYKNWYVDDSTAAAEVATGENISNSDRYSVNIPYSGTFFSGGGLVDYALKDIVKSQFSVEFVPNIANWYTVNNDGWMFNGDVRDFVKKYGDKVKVGDIDYFHASPVCKRYSTANNLGSSEDNVTDSPLDITTARAAAELVMKAKPKVFTVENVKGYQGSEAMKVITKALKHAGYKYDIQVYKASDYGAATSRERLFLRAVRDDGGDAERLLKESVPTKTTPNPNDVVGWYPRVAKYIPKLPKVELSDYMNERFTRMEWNGALSKAGIDPNNLKTPLLILGGNRGGELTIAKGDAHTPSPTILAGSNEAVILIPKKDGYEIRKATPRVLAAIQGLDDDFKLPMGIDKGNETDQQREDHSNLAYTIIGNGVPVELTRAIVKPLLESAVINNESYNPARGESEPLIHEADLASESWMADDREGRFSISMPERLSPTFEKNWKFNQDQTEVGGKLRTLRGSSIERYKGNVGKAVGSSIYLHKNYALDVIPKDVYTKAVMLIKGSHPDFSWNCVMYDAKKGIVRFDEAPDFDTAREPIPGKMYSVDANEKTVREIKTGNDHIWHHKWMWVKNDYKGFDVAESWNWSKLYLSVLRDTYNVQDWNSSEGRVDNVGVANGSGSGLTLWNEQLKYFGLPLEGEKADFNSKTEAEKYLDYLDEHFEERANASYDESDEDEGQAATSEGTSQNQAPSTFTTYKLKPSDRILDWGGGRYDTAKVALEGYYPGMVFNVYDPFNRTESYNASVLSNYKNNKADVIGINNVLNVISSKVAQRQVLAESKQYLKDDGVAMITIYEGSKSEIPAFSKYKKNPKTNRKDIGTDWQNNMLAETYMPMVKDYYKFAKRSGNIIFASDNESSLNERMKSKLSTEEKSTLKNEHVLPAIKKKLDMKTATGDARYSASVDSDGNALTEAQQEFFKDSKVRDDSGSLIPMYHGTTADFTIFDKNKIDYKNAKLQGFWFTSNPDFAYQYGSIKEYYVNISKPIPTDHVTITAEQLSDISGHPAKNCEQALKHFDNDYDVINMLTQGDRPERYRDVISKLMDVTGYDGYIVEDGDSKIAVAFESNQAKLTSNESPTSDDDIRYSLSVDSNGNKLTEAQDKFFADSKIRDEDGNLRVVYHGTMEDFTIFDKTKSRTNMDIQGMFFSPWEIDAGGYGENVNAYYLNIKNPAPESVGYKALKKFQGQNGAGIKAREYLISQGYDGVNNGNEEYIAFDSNQIKAISNESPTQDDDVRFSYAPIFYPKMLEVISGIKGDKMSADSVVNYLKGKGVKDEEIKWSGIEQFLEGQKSVTKESLELFADTSLPQVDEIILSGEDTRWGNDNNKLDGGTNYREILFQLPDSNYSNRPMYIHWGQNGILAHARIQDFQTKDGMKMLFIEEIQSDWHNVGKKEGYKSEGLKSDSSKLTIKQRGINSNVNMPIWAIYDENGIYLGSLTRETEEEARTDFQPYFEEERSRAIDALVPDAPFKNTYTDFVLKRLLRMAAEEGYDSVGWTTGKQQEKRWSSKYAEGYRIEYDQDIPKFLNKYGKKWGAKVTHAELKATYQNSNPSAYIDNNGNHIDVVGDWIESKIYEFSKANRNSEYYTPDELVRKNFKISKDTNGGVDIIFEPTAEVIAYLKPIGQVDSPVWEFPITESMKDAVLYDGQPMYSFNPDTTLVDETLDVQQKFNAYYEAYQKAIKDLNEAERQMTFTKFKTYTQTSIADEVKKLRDDYKTTYPMSKMAPEIKYIAEQIHNADATPNWNDLYGRARQLAVNICQNSAYVYDQKWPMFRDMKKDLTATPVSLSAEARESMTDYTAFAQDNRKYITLRNEGGRKVQDVYAEFQNKYGMEYFPNMEDEVDMLEQLVDVETMLKSVIDNPNDADMNQAAGYLANEILSNVLYAQQTDKLKDVPPTFADRMKAHYEERLANQKERYKAKMDKMEMDYKTQIHSALTRQKARYELTIAGIIDHNRLMKKNAHDRKVKSDTLRKVEKMLGRLKNLSKKTTAANRMLISGAIGEWNVISKRAFNGKTILNMGDVKAWVEDIKSKNKDQMAEMKVDEYHVPPELEALITKYEGKGQMPIRELGVDDLNALLTGFKSLYTQVQNDRRFLESKVAHDAFTAGMAEWNYQQGLESPNKTKAGRAKMGYISAMLSPERYLHAVTGYNEDSPLYKLGKEVGLGEQKVLDYENKASELFKKWFDDKEFMKSITGKKAKTMTIKGQDHGVTKDIEVTRGTAILLYLQSLNEDNMKHLANGGATLPDITRLRDGDNIKKSVRENDKKYTFTAEQLASINLTENEKAFCNAVQNYYNNFASPQINKVSEILWGYSLANVRNYIPIITNRDYLGINASTQGEADPTTSVLNQGWMKERIQGTTAVYITDIIDVLADSIHGQGRFVGLAIPVRNFNKLLNFSTHEMEEYTNDKGETKKRIKYQNEYSIKNMLRSKYGNGSVQYIEKALADIQIKKGDADSFGAWLNKAKGNYAQAVLNLNFKVAATQAASYWAAISVLGEGPVWQAILSEHKTNPSIYELDTMQRYRERGFNQAETGDIRSTGKKGLPKVLDWITAVDIFTTRGLIRACEIYVNKNYKDLKQGSEAWNKKVAEIHQRVIVETQPNYSTWERPGIMRSDNALVRATVMFKTQPFQNYNFTYDALQNLKAKKQALENATDETERAKLKAEIKSASKTASNSLKGLMISTTVYAALRFAYQALIGNLKNYKDDDDDELKPASVTKGLIKDIAGNIANIFLGGSEAFDLINAMVTGDTYYGFEVSALGGITDAAEAVLNLYRNTASVIKDGEDSEVEWDKYYPKFISNISDILMFKGIPADNIVKDAKILTKVIFKMVYGEKMIGNETRLDDYAQMKFWGELGTSSGKQTAYDNLFAKYGTDEYETLYNQMLEDGLSKSSIDEQISKRLFNSIETYDDVFDTKVDVDAELKKKVSEVVKVNDDKSLRPYSSGTALSNIIKDKQIRGEDGRRLERNQYTLTEDEYEKYVTTYENRYWNSAEALLGKEGLDEAKVLLASKEVAKTLTIDEYLSGHEEANLNGLAEKYMLGKSGGLSETELVEFIARKKMVGEDGYSLRNADYFEIINGMDLTNQQKYNLYNNFDEKKKDENNPFSSVYKDYTPEQAFSVISAKNESTTYIPKVSDQTNLAQTIYEMNLSASKSYNMYKEQDDEEKHNPWSTYYAGIGADVVIDYFRKVDEVDDTASPDGKSDVARIIDSLEISDAKKYSLYNTRYETKRLNPWGENFNGVSTDTAINFLNALAKERSVDGSITNDDITKGINSMNLTDNHVKYLLWKSQNNVDKNNPWKSYK